MMPPLQTRVRVAPRAALLLGLATLLALAGCGGSSGGGSGGGGGGSVSGLAAPAGVSATASKLIVVTWLPVSGATGYNLYWGISPATAKGNGTLDAGVVSGMTLTGLDPSTTYYLVVTSTNSTGESAASAQVHATTAVPAPDKTGVGGSSGSGASSACINMPARNDPLFQYQWYLHNTGQSAFSSYGGIANEDIHLCDVAERGSGVTVAVVDTGVEALHEDLTHLVTASSGTTSYNFAKGTNNPTNTIDVHGDHGTSVAGIIGATADNSKGISGLAGSATLVGYNLLGPATAGSALEEADALGAAPYSAGVQVFNQSWGFDSFDAINAADLNPDAEANYRDGVTLLRGGKGAIYVKAAGNGFGADFDPYSGECTTPTLPCQNANLDPYNTLPYQIVVGAVNAKGVRSSYSTTGSALWVSAPGGEYGYDYNEGWLPPPDNPHEAFEPAIVTTDQSGCTKGYSLSPDKNSPNFFEANSDKDVNHFQQNLNPSCNYTSTFNGTSSATPVLSGVAALLLEANPNLTWRDVKHILAATSEPIDPGFTPILIQLGGGPYTAEPAWTTNAAGYHFHNWYGFGRVHVKNAVAMAAGYTANAWGSFADTGFLAGTVDSAAIPDDSPLGTSGSNAVSGAPGFIEAVQVRVNITHSFPGDVGIELTAPSGTRSVLLNIRSALGASAYSFVDWVMLTNAFYGENPNGAWSLKVVDGVPADAGTLNSWAIRIFGH